MIQGSWFDCACALSGVFSAIYWVKSARIPIPAGLYDGGAKEKAAFERIGRLNAKAAAFAAFAAAEPAFKALGQWIGWVYPG